MKTFGFPPTEDADNLMNHVAKIPGRVILALGLAPSIWLVYLDMAGSPASG